MKKEMKKIEEQPKVKTIKKLNGVVVSDKMDKTVVVEVTEKKTHPMYGKIYKASRKIQAHDVNNEFKPGDYVEIVETRPFAKNKSWQVTKLAGKANLDRRAK